MKKKRATKTCYNCCMTDYCQWQKTEGIVCFERLVWCLREPRNKNEKKYRCKYYEEDCPKFRQQN